MSALPEPYYDRAGITIYVGDNRDVLPHIGPVHAVCTDPPYGLTQAKRNVPAPTNDSPYNRHRVGVNGDVKPVGGFMGKQWDGTGVERDPELWRAISAAMLPGAHLLAFGGTRTYHRMAVAIEDAGYEIRDTLQWIYGSGMPKGWNFSNRIPNDQWCRCTGGNAVSYNHEGDDHGEPQTEHNLRSMRHADVPASVHIGAERREVLHTSVSEPSAPAYRETNSTGFHEGREQPGMEGRALHRTGEGIRDGAPTGPPTSTAQRVRAGAHSGSGTNARQTTGTGRGSASHQSAEGRQPTGELEDLPESPRSLDDRALRNGGACPRCGKLSQDYRGFDVALKPAYEPIIMARKPFKGTVAANVLRHGTGAINVDACRIGLKPGGQKGEGGRLEHRPNSTEHEGWGMTLSGNNNDGKGRWPANVILDEAAADVLDKQSGVSRSSTAGVKPRSGETNIYGGNALLSSKTKHSGTMEYGDTGGASRFFYVAKASRRERNAGLEGMPERAAHELTDARISTASNRRCATCGRVKFGQPHCECAEPQWEETTGSKGGNFHPTVKPLALMRYLIQMVTPPEGIVLDPFMGSGSTLVAAAELGFPAIGIELSEEYAEIAARRVNHALDERAGYLPGMEVLG